MSSEAAAYFPDTLGSASDVDAPASASSPVMVQPNSGSASPVVAVHSPIRESSDEDLLIQVGKGSKEALSVLFQRHARAVLSIARRILRDDCEAEDLLQELFLFIFQKASIFDAAKGSGASWIIQMAYCRAIDRRRYLSFRQHYNGEELDEDRLTGHQGRISIDGLAGRALLEKLRRELSPEQIQTMELHFFEGYSFHEIAEKTGRTFGSVRNHYYRGLERLRSHIFPGKRISK